MMHLQTVIDHIFIKEGDHYHVSDQPTGRGGIILPTLQAYFDAVAPGGKPATITNLQALTHEEARAVVEWKLRQDATRYKFDHVADESLRLHLMDFAYNSGPALAVRWLQRCVQVPRTGVMDAQTLATVNAADPFLLHHAYMCARLLMVDLWTDEERNKKWEEGLENRILAFSRLPVP